MRTLARLPTAALFACSTITLTFTAGCTDQPYTSAQQQAQNACQAFGPKALSGALIGGLGGAGAGVIGGIMVGHNLDQRDCMQAQRALAQVRYAPSGQAVAWSSASGSAGSYTPISGEYAGENGRVCRLVRQDATLVGHQPTSGNVVTCRTADGDYQTVTPAPQG